MPAAGSAPPGTYSVAEVCGEVRELLRQALPGFWVAGEVQRVRRSQRGHLYFELVEKGTGDEVVAKLEAVIWRRDHQVVARELRQAGQQIEDGQQIRCWGEADFYPPFGRLQLVVRRVDPLFALGLLEQRRRETLEALSREGLLELNKGRKLASVPLRIGLVTSRDAAAYHDFLSTLRESGFGFQVSFVHAAVQGKAAEEEVAAALGTLGGLPLDCLVLVRGGGSRTDLAAFDSRRIAEAVARSPLPVITGLGHEIDESIADRAAHTATKTPTRAAELLVQTVAEADRRWREARRALVALAGEPLRRGRRRIAAAERGLGAVRFRVAAERRRLETFAGQLGRAAARRVTADRTRLEGLAGDLRLRPARALARRRLLPDETARRVVAAAASRLREGHARLEGWRRLLEGLSPARTLARGFSITRDGRGVLVRSADQVEPDDRISTELAAGTVTSRVEEVQ